MSKDSGPDGDQKKLTLAPLSFEEALEGLLQVPPPPKDERPEPDPGREPPREKLPRKRQPKQDKEGGGANGLPSSTTVISSHRSGRISTVRAALYPDAPHRTSGR